MTPAPDLSNWLSREQACAALGIKDRTLDLYVSEGKLHPQKYGRAYVFDPEEVSARQKASNGLVLANSATPQSLAEQTPQSPQAVAEIAAELVLARLAERIGGQVAAAVQGVGSQLVEVLKERFPAPMPDTMYVTYEEAVRITNLPRRLIVLMARGKKVRALQVNENQPARILRADLERLADPVRLAAWREQLSSTAADIRKVLDQRKRK